MSDNSFRSETHMGENTADSQEVGFINLKQRIPEVAGELRGDLAALNKLASDGGNASQYEAQRKELVAKADTLRRMLAQADRELMEQDVTMPAQAALGTIDAGLAKLPESLAPAAIQPEQAPTPGPNIQPLSDQGRGVTPPVAEAPPTLPQIKKLPGQS